ncbi:MAG: hypothetical protein HKN08_02990 [Gammaproteobacteria bacterium]|nr:hypothetical protein [Gammaproteobacteria bacterium]
MELLKNFSTREKNLWSELLVDIVVALYYFPKMLLMLLVGQEALTGAAMAGLVTSTVIVAIVTASIIALFLHAEKTPEHVDERDHLFEYRGSRTAYLVLVICVVALMGTIIVQELMPDFTRDRFVELSPVAIAHLLLLALVVSSTVKSVTQLFFYRRGY